MDDNLSTQFFSFEVNMDKKVNDILETVFRALTEKGYNPVNQIVGYVMSGDPTYITSHLGARSLIMKVERDELVEVILKKYIETNGWDQK
ncbi:MAG: IreB family regulatory phosphoprotein [Lachnospiraceae bacterium]|nr:IreB family regulatory phosphoprotein [Lachnospiraceae bacterium]